MTSSLEAYLRLDALSRMRERLTSQAACLAAAIERIGAIPGLVLEIGLGKGRTYDFLRSRLATREIFAFDRDLHAPAALHPDPAHMVRGEFRTSFPAAAVSPARRSAA